MRVRVRVARRDVFARLELGVVAAAVARAACEAVVAGDARVTEDAQAVTPVRVRLIRGRGGVRARARARARAKVKARVKVRVRLRDRVGVRGRPGAPRCLRTTAGALPSGRRRRCPARTPRHRAPWVTGSGLGLGSGLG